ncbi:hypothetical protein D0C16_11570 [Cellvibrio sp. KY-GH-1]|uniref:DUF6030 family protein n=1 Tax=Cellvibrio sp. KY-GH-1 TaxID=2303332 RepID=UPI00124553CD|nr:DUF6030 family protein [Cellvibrio sp. KY-GH-1]QEY16564.1 hypothetical protein D0C16_11570 [Cellvibrio sp. KY-GH-1]
MKITTICKVIVLGTLSCTTYASNLTKSSPQQACNAMAKVGLITNGWKNRYEDSYGCSSPYKDIGNAYPLPNNLAFYAEGNSSKVDKVKIVLNFNDTSNTKNAYAELQKAAALLVTEFTGSAITQALKTAIASRSNISTTINNASVTVEKIDWPSGGYEIQVIIH